MGNQIIIMSRLYLRILSILLLSSLFSVAQVRVSGHIKNEGDLEPIPNVHIIYENSKGTFSDSNGYFELNIAQGFHKLFLQHIAYKLKSIDLNVTDNLAQTIDIKLQTKYDQLETVVLSAGKFEQRLEDISVSLDLIKGKTIEYQNNYNIEQNIAQAPGIHNIDGQINIRGGSGWSYGAGSRVLVLLDGLPITNSATGAVQWELIPAENIERIEIIKGASSVLFGSAALNGVINITSKKPTTKPQTTVTAYNTYFDKAKRASLNWASPLNISLNEYGFNFNHSQKRKNVSYSFGLQTHNSEGYQGLIDTLITETDTTQKIHHLGNDRVRLYLNTHFISKRIKGLEYGLNTSYLRFNETDGFLYLNDSLGYSPFSGKNYSLFKSAQLNINPKASYLNTRNNTKHDFQARLLQTNFNPDGTEKLNNYIALYSEYLFQKYFEKNTLTSGFTMNHFVGLSNFFESKQNAVNYALFSQLDHTKGPLLYSFGARYEAYNVRNRTEGKPIFRGGVNYQVNDRHFFRASIGQGYRFPSMYELFLYRDAGQISIYSNPELKAETGYTAEIGYKYKWAPNDSFKSYFDVAVFKMRYNDMVEYSYGLWGDSTRLNPLGIGFKPINVGQTKITGFDLSVLAEGSVGEWDIYTRMSYTYMVPVALKPNDVYGSYNDRLDALVESFVSNGAIDTSLIPVTVIEQIAAAQSLLSYNSTSSNPESETLKYRYRHMAKLDLAITRGKWTIGSHLHYNSFMENIDQLFESGAFNSEVIDIFTLADANIFDMGIKQSRERLNSGDFIADVRLLYNFNKDFSIQCLVENAGNREYQIRPGSLGAPRTFSVKITSKF